MKIHSEPAFENYSFMVCDWIDENNEFIFQERTFWPRRVYYNGRNLILCDISSSITVEYWITRQIYKNFELASKEFSSSRKLLLR